MFIYVYTICFAATGMNRRNKRPESKLFSQQLITVIIEFSFSPFLHFRLVVSQDAPNVEQPPASGGPPSGVGSYSSSNSGLSAISDGENMA